MSHLPASFNPGVVCPSPAYALRSFWTFSCKLSPITRILMYVYDDQLRRRNDLWVIDQDPWLLDSRKVKGERGGIGTISIH